MHKSIISYRNMIDGGLILVPESAYGAYDNNFICEPGLPYIIVSNMNQLQRALQPIMIKMVDELAKRVYETLNYFLNDYYTGWTPNSYRRTEAFLRSAVKVDAHPDKGGIRACVYIDYNSMDDYVNATGYQVAQWANTGRHGGLSVNHKPRVWNDTLDETINNGSLLQLAI